MADYVIATDSSCDLSQERVQSLELAVASLTVHFKGKDYPNLLDGSAIGFKELYDGLRAGEIPTTSAVNVGGWTELCEPFLKDGKDVLILAFSSGLSATYDSARMAADELGRQYPDRSIYVVDTLCASLGQGLIVQYAVMEKRAGRTIEQVRDYVESNKLRLCHWFTVDDLFHLKRGGRVSGATALLGSILGIKPILHVDNQGKLINVTKERGRKKTLDAVVDRVGSVAVEPEKQVLFISHGDCLEEAEYCGKLAREKFGFQDVYINYVGPVIGSHSGVGTIAIFCYGRER